MDGMRLYCVDEHHDAPCPQPCGGCEADCSGRIVDATQAKREFPDWEGE